MSSPSHKKVFFEINITPLTDIFLVLLIIMMVVAPILTNSRRDIKTPTINSGNQINQEWPVIEVSPDGQFFIKGNLVSGVGLDDSLRTQRPPQGKENTLLLRADKNVKSELVLKVLEAAKKAEFERVVLAGESKSPAVAASEATPAAEPKADGASATPPAKTGAAS